MKAAAFAVPAVVILTHFAGDGAGRESLVIVGVACLFVATMVAYEIYRGLHPERPEATTTDDPGGVSTQEQASERIAELNREIWRQEQCGR